MEHYSRLLIRLILLLGLYLALSPFNPRDAQALDLDDYADTTLASLASTLHKDCILNKDEDMDEVSEILDDIELTSEERAEDSVEVASVVEDDFNDIYSDLKSELDELLDDEIDVGDSQAEEDAAPGELMAAFQIVLRSHTDDSAVPALEALLDSLEQLRLGIKEPLVEERQHVQDAETAVQNVLSLMK